MEASPETQDPHQSPDLRWVIGQLAAAFPDVPVSWEPANFILAEVRLIQSVGVLKIKRGVLRLVRSPKRVGIEGELKRLLAVTRRAITEPLTNSEFPQTWSETSDVARTLLRWDGGAAVDNGRAGWVHDKFRGRYQLLPRPEDALPLIEKALGDLAAAPGHERRKRKADAAEEALSAAIASAFATLSNASKPKASERTMMIRISAFARALDEKFGLGIYKKGSRQLRSLQRKYSAKLL